MIQWMYYLILSGTSWVKGRSLSSQVRSLLFVVYEPVLCPHQSVYSLYSYTIFGFLSGLQRRASSGSRYIEAGYLQHNAHFFIAH